MNWLPGFFSPSAAWLFFLIPPLILFYFLKLKRPRQDVASLVLWRQVLQDQRVNSPFQKFKKNILLFLQLLLLLLLILAAMQPFIRGRENRAARRPVLIDCSASMAAVDKNGGKTRLDAARDQLVDIIDNKLPDEEISIISFSDTARQRTQFTDNKKILMDAVRDLTVDDTASNLEDALQMAQALSRSHSFQEVLLISDGNFPEKASVDLPFEVNFQQVGPGAANLGIVACSARRASNSKWDIFVEVEGTADTDGGAAVQIESQINGTSTTLKNEYVKLEKGASSRVIFRIDGSTPQFITVKLLPDTKVDSLSSDNVAHMALPRLRPLNIYIPESLGAYRHALLTSPEELNIWPDASKGTDPASFDLVISDKPDHLALETKSRMMIGMVPKELEDIVEITPGNAEVVDWKLEAPLLRHVQLREVLIMDTPALAEGADVTTLADRRWDTLIHGTTGPLLLEKRTAGEYNAHLLFHSNRSTFPYRVGFPILVANLVNEALNVSKMSERSATRTGALGDLTLSPDTDFTIKHEGRSAQTLTSASNGDLSGIATRKVGVYDILESGNLAARRGANLLTASETRLETVDEIQFKEFTVGVAAEPVKTDRPYWHLLAVLALLVLIFEWWYFQRKPGGFAKAS